MGTTVTQFIFIAIAAFLRTTVHGWQTRNVTGLHYRAAFVTSWLMTAGDVIIVWTVSHKGWYVFLPLGIGGSLGVLTSMRLHDWFFQLAKCNSDKGEVVEVPYESMITTDYGEIYINEKGVILDADIHPDFGKLPRSFDVAEYIGAYGILDNCIEIADIGCTNADGVYIPPQIAYRQGVARRMAKVMGIDLENIAAADLVNAATQVYVLRDTKDSLQALFGDISRNYLAARQEALKKYAGLIGLAVEEEKLNAEYRREIQVRFDRMRGVSTKRPAK